MPLRHLVISGHHRVECEYVLWASTSLCNSKKKYMSYFITHWTTETQMKIFETPVAVQGQSPTSAWHDLSIDWLPPYVIIFKPISQISYVFFEQILSFPFVNGSYGVVYYFSPTWHSNIFNSIYEVTWFAWYNNFVISSSHENHMLRRYIHVSLQYCIHIFAFFA